MNREQNDFESLQRLLRAKCFEQPPPGYFQRFSDRVIARIEADQEMRQYSGWWAWMMDKFETRPVLACAYGVAVSSLLIAGFKLSQAFENELAATPFEQPAWLATAPGAVPIQNLLSGGLVREQPASVFRRSLSPAFGLEFANQSSQSPALVQPVSYSTGY